MYVAFMEPRARQRYSEKLYIVGIPLEQLFIKRLEQPYAQQLTTTMLQVNGSVYVVANPRGRNSYTWIAYRPRKINAELISLELFS